MVRPGCEYGKHLYLLAMGELVKVGRSMDVKRRLSEHRNANPFGDIKLVCVFEDQGFVDNSVLSALLFAGHERRSEWVHCTVQEALEAIGQCLV